MVKININILLEEVNKTCVLNKSNKILNSKGFERVYFNTTIYKHNLDSRLINIIFVFKLYLSNSKLKI